MVANATPVQNIAESDVDNGDTKQEDPAKNGKSYKCINLIDYSSIKLNVILPMINLIYLWHANLRANVYMQE